MKIQNFNKIFDQGKIISSSRQGYLKTSYNEILKRLGEPSSLESGDGKVQAQWILEFEDGTIATVYDYKQYDCNVEDVELWSIGGFDQEAAKYVQIIFEE